MEVSKETVLKAWKDEGFRNSLSPEVQAAIPDRPRSADGDELSDDQLEAAAGGTTLACGALFVTAFGAGVKAAED